MSDLIRIPENVTVDQYVDPTGAYYLIEWQCCEVLIEERDQAQTVVDMLVQIEQLQAENKTILANVGADMKLVESNANEWVKAKQREIDQLQADLKTQTELAEHYRKAAVLYPGSEG